MRGRLAISTVLTLALVAAGCGDDGGSGAPFASEGGDTDVDEILEDLAGRDLEDTKEVAEDLVDQFSTGGSGSVEFQGETIQFEAEVCFAGQDDFTAEGLGTAAEGTPVWISISYMEDAREEMLAIMDEQTIGLLYGDADVLISQDFALEFGRDELFGSAPDDMPSVGASKLGASGDDITIDVGGSSASGSGMATDFHLVLGEFDDKHSFSFEASCG